MIDGPADAGKGADVVEEGVVALDGMLKCKSIKIFPALPWIPLLCIPNSYLWRYLERFLSNCTAYAEAVVNPAHDLTTMSSDQAEPYLDIYIGDEIAYNSQLAAYRLTSSLLQKNAAIYGLPDKPEDLSEEQQQLLQEIQVCGLRSSTSEYVRLIPSVDDLSVRAIAVHLSEATTRRALSLHPGPCTRSCQNEGELHRAVHW